ncbi:hypothetical protein COHA_006784 [Chlorella ohadii]|uniref:Uncharacterized protein n=1 Tax=Chlorella ohadii TaxID=2649997 RepID=A0AAD5DKW6_9CHLO|nr:hypothetical protein COHA_006784 [Chlorella ohadii]
MALGSVTVLDGTSRGLRWAQRAQQRRRHGLPVLAPSSKARKAKQHSGSSKQADGSSCGAEDGDAGLAEAKPAAGAAAAESNCCRISADGSRLAAADSTEAAAAAAAVEKAAAHHDEAIATQQGSQPPHGANGSLDGRASTAPPPRPAGRSFALAQQQAASFVRPGSQAGDDALAEPPPRPELALARGLSRRVRDLSTGRPRLVRLAALTVITSSFSAAYCCQIAAPGFVDPSLVQLVNMFTVLGVALVQSVLLRHRLPLSIWPCSAVMLGGAAMVIVPSIGSGSGAGLNDWRGWLGFGLSLASMAATVVYFVSLQASRRLGFTSLQLQYLYLLLSVAVLLPISLGVDGTDWSANFRGWTAGDWAVLCVMSCCVVISANLCIQYSTWVLGAPTVSMFYGLRLVAAIVESKIILGATVIKEPIAGTVVTVCAGKRSMLLHACCHEGLG